MHLVGYILEYIYDARNHECQVYIVFLRPSVRPCMFWDISNVFPAHAMCRELGIGGIAPLILKLETGLGDWQAAHSG